MNEARTCEQCGAVLDSSAPEGLCPRCVLATIAGGALNNSPGPDASRANPRIRYFGDYELLEEIARGGMGVVWKARQVSLNRAVAVKMILAGEFASEEFVHRFRKEAQAAANLHHPNIVAIHEVGVHEGHHYFSMDYVEGKNLANLARDTPLPARQAARYLKTIAEAIHYAHQRGILHRDLKPSNVIIDEFNEPRVTDFGLAKQINSEAELTPTGQILGSPNFAPPEQAAGRTHQIEPRSDVYGLGAILYHLLTGRPPFVAATIQETLALVQHSEPVSLRGLNPDVPRDLETICLKCLQKKLERRYATAADLAEDLGHFLRAEPIRARPVSVAERAWRWCRREPALAQLAATAAISALGLIVALTLHAASVNRERLKAERERLKAEYASTLLAQILSSIDDPAAFGRGFKSWETRAGRLVREEKFSRDGKVKLTFSMTESNAVRVCDARTGEQLYPPLVHAAGVTSFEFSHDGTSILTVCADAPSVPGAGYLWETSTGKSIAILRASSRTDEGVHHVPVHRAEFSPDGRLVVTDSVGGEARVWDVSKRQVQPFHPSNELTSQMIAMLMREASVISSRFSLDGRFIITVAKNFRVQLWDARTGKPWKPFP